MFDQIKKLIQTSFVFYGLVFLLAWRLIDFDKIQSGSDFQVLHSSVSPQLKQLLYKDRLNKEILRNCIRYYESLTTYVPNGEYASDILGYCYYYSGRYEDALRSYQRIVELKPNIFWNHFNLGAVYLRMGKIDEAKEALIKAQQASFDRTLNYLSAQKAIYAPFLEELRDADQLRERLTAGFEKCGQLLKAIDGHLKPESIEPQIF